MKTDPFGSMQNMINQFKQFMGNPMGYAMQRNLGIPQEYMNNPDEAIQYLMNTGKLTQAQYNELNKTAKQIQPMFKQFLK